MIRESTYIKWLNLFNFIRFLYLEKYIEQETYKEMQDNLMGIKWLFGKEDE